MTAALLTPETRWYCPNCGHEDVTKQAGHHVRFHACPRLFGLSAPMVIKGVKAHVFAVEREDYVGHELVQTDGRGRPIMSVITERADGQDVAVYAPTARNNAPGIPPEFAHNSWSASKIFSAFITDALNNTAALDLNSDTIEAALFDNSITPSQSAAAASTAYGAGVWASGGVSDASGWPALGRPLAGIASGFSSNVFTFDANDTASANSTTTLTNATGVLVYDHTLAAPVADQGICYNYLGGANSVVNGSFTVVWNASGIMFLTL